MVHDPSPSSSVRTVSNKPDHAPVKGASPNSISSPQQGSSSQELPKTVTQPEPWAISQEQLVAEVKTIYARLIIVEEKCIQVDAKQAKLTQEAPPGTQPKLNNEQWQALIALHRTHLREHHGFSYQINTHLQR